MVCAKGRGRKRLRLATSGNARPNFGHREKSNGFLREGSPLFRGISPLEARSLGPRSARDLFTGTAKRASLTAPAPTSFPAFPCPCAATGGPPRRPPRAGRSL